MVGGKFQESLGEISESLGEILGERLMRPVGRNTIQSQHLLTRLNGVTLLNSVAVLQ